MARTANVFARVEPELKEQAESVLDQLGIPMSNAVGMFLRQIVLQKGIPFEMKLPRTAPLTYGSLTKEQFDKEIEKGMSDVKAGRVYSSDAIEAEMEVLVDDQWVKTRMEMNLAREWYLVGTPYCGDLEYVRARIRE